LSEHGYNPPAIQGGEVPGLQDISSNSLFSVKRVECLRNVQDSGFSMMFMSVM
jgi:hypothetical protein